MELKSVFKIFVLAISMGPNYAIKEITPLITGGSLARIGKLPYQAHLRMIGADGETFTCGGSILSENWILTAAHCIDGFRKIYVTVGSTVIGAENTGQTFPITKTSNIIVHQNYNESGYLYDIGLLKLESKIKFNNFTKAVKLPMKYENTISYENCTGIASGWGKTSEKQDKSKNLLYVSLKIISNDECEKYYKIPFHPSLLCTSTKGKRSICTGDSGGPFVLKKINLIGIAAFGPNGEDDLPACEIEQPAVFTRVSYYLDWIKEKIG